MNPHKDGDEGVASPQSFPHWGHDSKDKTQSTKQQHMEESPRPEAGQSSASLSERSINNLIHFKCGNESSDQSQEQQYAPESPRTDPGPSGVSFKSDQSTQRLLDFKGGYGSPKQSDLQRPRALSGQSVQQQKSHLDSILSLLEENVDRFVKYEMKRVQRRLCAAYGEFPESENEDVELLEGEERQQRMRSREAFVGIAMHFLRTMKQEELAICLQSAISAPGFQQKMKSNIQRKCQYVFEGIAKKGNQTLLNQIYTELYITEGEASEVNEEHEVRQIESMSRKMAIPQSTIRCEDIFKDSFGGDGAIRTVLTKGVAGIGKTVLTQKFTLDWAEDKANQDIDLTFPFAFRELNMLKDKKFSLVGLVHHFFKETEEAGIWSFQDFRVVFILDGLDENRLPLNFHSNETVTDVRKSTSVDVLLTNLIRGKLLPSARLWITTRPAAANQIPPECVSVVTEVRGFTDPQKEEYFRKRFRDTEQATAIISHIKSSQSLHIMCHIPVFCWISATVLEDMLKSRRGDELPKTLTEMYIHLLMVQSKMKSLKYDGGAATDHHWSLGDDQLIASLGKLAFEQLQKGHLIFYESDLTECGFDVQAASVCSGVFTQIFRAEGGLYPAKVFCFVHLSVQEFLAALHVHQTFIKSGVNLLAKQSYLANFFRHKPEQIQLLQSAVDQALQSPNGHLDLFLRFLLGVSLQTNQFLLQGLPPETQCYSDTNQKAIDYIKAKMSETLSPERNINLLHCLNELQDRSLVVEIQRQLRSGLLSTHELSPAQWSALAFILLSSEEELTVFELKKYQASENAFLKLLPVVRASKQILLSGCNLSERTCVALASVLSSQSCRLTELDLSNNHLKDSGVELLSVGLKSPNCKLEILRLRLCGLTEEGCDALALVSRSSCLRELDLSSNNLLDSGVKLLSTGLVSPRCKLQILRLNHCKLSERSGEVLSTVLGSGSSSLKELDLNNNNLQDKGMELLCAGLGAPHCNLDTLGLSSCNLSERSCTALSSVLGSECSCLRELDLSNNNLKDSGVEQLSTGLKSSHCRLETLSLSGCLITEKGCASLASALKSNSSSLRVLDLSYNHPGHNGQKVLSADPEGPLWKLETLKLDHGGEQRLKPGLKKYFRKLTLNTQTANSKLQLSDDNSRVTHVKKDQAYADHADRFDYWPQLMCRDGLCGRWYWEVEWRGNVHIAVAYQGVKRKGESGYCVFGLNDQSWSLNCSSGGFSAFHNNRVIAIATTPSDSNKVAVYVDCSLGVLSFYKVSSKTLVHLHTFHTTFTEPLHPGFGFRFWTDSSVSLCDPSDKELPTV